MSARTRDVYETANRFSLRDVVAGPEVTMQQPIPVQSTGGMFRVKQPAPESPQLTAATMGGAVSMKLNLSNLQTRPQKQQQPLQMAAAPRTKQGDAIIPNLSFSFGNNNNNNSGKSFSKQATSPMQSSMLSHQTQQSIAEQQAARATKEVDKQEIMRLAAYIEDLTARLKRTQLKLEQTEHSMKHTQKLLTSERQTAAKQNDAFKKELATAHEAEAALRTELSARPQRSALSQSAFSQAVGTILADEQRVELHSREVQELEGKIKALGDAKVLIEAEVTGVKKLCNQANADLEELRLQQTDLKATAEEHHRMIKVAEEALQTIEARKKLASEDVKVTLEKHDGLVEEHTNLTNKILDAKSTFVDLSAKLEETRALTVEARAVEAAAKKAAADAANEAMAATQSLTTKTDAAGLELHLRSSRLESLRTELVELEGKQATASRALDTARAASAVEYEKVGSVKEQLASTNSALEKATRALEVTKTDLDIMMAKKQNIAAEMTGLIDDDNDVPEMLLDDDEEAPSRKKSSPTGAPDASSMEGSLLDVPVSVPTATPQRPPVEITGHIPTNMPGCGGSTAMRRAAIASLTRLHPCRAIIDAHTDMSTHFLGAACDTQAAPVTTSKDAQTKMVEAVIGDLKAALTNISEHKLPVTRMAMAI